MIQLENQGIGLQSSHGAATFFIRCGHRDHISVEGASMNAIKQFLADHKIGAHTFVVAWGVVDVLWYTNTDFHTYIASLLMALPAWLHAFVFGIIVPVLVYLKATKKPSDEQV